MTQENTEQNNQQQHTKKKPFYKVGQKVYLHSVGKRGEVKEVIPKETSVLVEYTQRADDGQMETVSRKFEFREVSPYKEKKYNPNEAFWMINEFHDKFGHPIAEIPTPMDKEMALNRANWSAEELIELLYATVGGNHSKFEDLFAELIHGMHQSKDKILEKNETIGDILTAQADALTDELVFNQGSFNVIGVEPFNLLKIVHKSNMSKLDDNNQPIYREDGKIAKSDNFIPPEPKLKEEVIRQYGVKSKRTPKGSTENPVSVNRMYKKE